MVPERDAREAPEAGSERAGHEWRDDPRFRTAIEALLDGFVLYSSVRDESGAIVDLRCEYANAASVANGGLPPEEQVGRTMLDIYPGAEGEGYFAQYVRVVETGEPLDLEVPWYVDKNVTGAFEIHCARIDDGCALVFRNVTERRETEAALQASEARIHGFLDAIPAGVAVVGLNGMDYLNATGEALLGQGVVPLRTAGEYPSVYGVQREGTDQPYPSEEMPLARAFFEGVSTGARDVVIRRPDRDIPLDTFATPLRDETTDEILGAIAVFIDATERRAQDARLEALVADVERANERLSDFASDAAHDLAEPLRAIAGFAELLRSRHGANLDEEAIDWLGLMLEGAARMRTLIDDLLAYARAGAGTFESSTVDLGALVVIAQEALHARITDAGAVVEVGELPVVEADATELARVLQNLLDNAIKFTRPGVPCRVTVDARQIGREWEVRVTDNGIGIPENQHDRVFAPFQRLVSSDTPGSGLGLAICQRVIERHDGRLWVEPAPEGGSCFCFTLPVDARLRARR